MKRPLCDAVWDALAPHRRVAVADAAAACGCAPATVVKWVRIWHLAGWVERYGLIDQHEVMRIVSWPDAPVTVTEGRDFLVSHPKGGRWRIHGGGGGPPLVTPLPTPWASA